MIVPKRLLERALSRSVKKLSHDELHGAVCVELFFGLRDNAAKEPHG
jgi:hypothetical protein